MITHRHHIIPRHAGGSDDPSNIVTLTIPEHAEAHKKLFEEHGRWQDEVAYLTLSGQIDKAEAMRQTQVKANLGNQNGKGNKGKKLTEKMKKDISIGMKGKQNAKGHNKSEKTKSRISKLMKGNQNARKGIKNANIQ